MLISSHYYDLLIGHFGIEKTQKLIALKSNGLMLRGNIESYVKKYNMCLALKLLKYKFDGYQQSFLVPTP